MLTSIGAWISIPLPITPVPMTLQVFFVLLSGAVLGARLGLLAEATCVLLGLIGFPVFAGATSGPAVLVGPTGGYLIGFMLGAYVTGLSAEVIPHLRLRSMLAAALLGLLPIYFIGSVWLCLWLRVSLVTAFSVGVLPFLPGDTAKAFTAAFVASRPHLRRFFQR